MNIAEKLLQREEQFDKGVKGKKIETCDVDCRMFVRATEDSKMKLNSVKSTLKAIQSSADQAEAKHSVSGCSSSKCNFRQFSRGFASK
jgi:dynactin complex subunit